MKKFFVAVLACGLPATLLIGGCKRETSSPATSSAPTPNESADQVTATGSGAVSAVGNELTYQNVHVQVPWNSSDPVVLMKVAQQAAAGRSLKLVGGKFALEISSDGKSLRLNDRDYGALKPGDRVVLSADGKLTVNGQERQPQPATTQSSP